MGSPNYRVRRATLDDIARLVELWNSMHFATNDLAKRITEFQLAEGEDGKLLGAVGLQILARQGLIHSEGFHDFALSEALRPLLWERLHSVATNHGLLRIWTQEHAPFWTHNGFGKPDKETTEKLPPAWRSGGAGWLTLKLREDFEEVISADKEFALFMASEKERTQRSLQQARMLKLLATLIVLGLLGLVIIGGFLVIKNNPHLLGR